MQWLSAPKLSEILSRVLPTVSEHAQEINFSVLPWAVPEEHVALQRELRDRMIDLPNDIGIFLRDSAEARSISLAGPIAESAGELLKVDPNLKEFRYRIVPRVIAEQSFWGRYFKACRDIRRELLPGEPPEPDFSASEECSAADATDAVCVSGSNASRGRTSAGTSAFATHVAGSAATTRASGAKTDSQDSKVEALPFAVAEDGLVCQPSSDSTDSAPHASKSVAVPLPPRAHLPPKHRRQRSRDSCNAAAAQWPDMKAQTVTRGATIAARAFSDVTRWRSPSGLAFPRRFLVACVEGGPRDDVAEGCADEESLGGSFASWLTQGWMQPPPTQPSESQPASDPSSNRSSRMSRAVSSATISSEGGYSDWSHVSDHFAPIARELTAATATWHFIDSPEAASRTSSLVSA